MSLLLIFILITVLNVITYTAKTLIQVKCGKWMASIITAINASVYVLLVIYTVCDLPLVTKLIVTVIANFLGVFVVKYIEERLRKDKLWKIEALIDPENSDLFKSFCTKKNLPYIYANLGKFYKFDIYAETQKQSDLIAEGIKLVRGKYVFAEESQNFIL